MSFLTPLLISLVFAITTWFSPAWSASSPSSQEINGKIYSLQTQETISFQELVSLLRVQDSVLLGELHDNPHHHRARADLIAVLTHPKLTIVAEHLPVGSLVKFSGTTLDSLVTAGFDAKGWQWPLHEVLFNAIRASNMDLYGGNISHSVSSAVFKSGATAIPSDLESIYQASPLRPESESQLNSDLKDSHCGQLPDQFVAPMRLIQRLKDASFSQLLLKHQPSILIAGNGHIRKDYGVPQILSSLAPKLKIISVGFIEEDDWKPEFKASLSAQYDYVWVTPNTPREDPCKDFSAPHLK